MTYTEAQVTAVARALCLENSTVCNVDNDDNWNLYSDEYLISAQVACTALETMAKP